MAERFPSQKPRAIIPPTPSPIHTSRLVLRPAQPSDLPGIFAIRSRQDLAAWLYPRTPDQTIIDTEKWFAGKSFSTADGTGAMHRRFLFVIVQKDDPSQEIIGTVGVNSLSPAPSIGYGLHPGFWGRGYASEAVGGLLGAWGSLLRAEDGKRGREKMYACCNRENVGSVRVLQKNGFTNYDEVEMEGDRVAFWELELGE